jgi:hypothetical protein
MIQSLGTDGGEGLLPWQQEPRPLAGMSPRLGVRQVPRLRAKTHFGVQARALPIGLHNFIEGVAKLLRFVGLLGSIGLSGSLGHGPP